MTFQVSGNTVRKLEEVTVEAPVVNTLQFKSKKEALSQPVIYVFCPEGHAKLIGTIVDDYSFDIVVNDYSITDFSKKVVCICYKVFITNFVWKCLLSFMNRAHIS